MTGRSSSIRAGRAYVELFLEKNPLERGLKAVDARLKAFGSQVAQISRSLAIATAAAAAPLVSSTVLFATFEQTMARVGALTNATAEDFARLEKRARELGATTVFTASDAAEALSFFALAGYDVEQMLAAIGPTLSLAAAGQLEIGQSADIVAKIMAGMGIAAQDVGRAVDVLTKAMTSANTDLPMLGDAFKYVGAIANTAGQSLEDITAAIQILSNAGIQGQMAGTTLRGALLSLTDPSKEAAEMMAALGIDIADAAGQMLPLPDIIAQFERALAGMGNVEQLEAIGTIFDARQAAGFAKLIGAGADELRRFSGALEDAGGTADRIAGRQLDTLKGAFLLITSALEEVQISIGNALKGPLREAATFIQDLFTATAAWLEANEQVVQTYAKWVVGLGLVTAAMLSLSLAVTVVSYAVGGATTLISLGLTTMALIAKATAAAFTLMWTAISGPAGLIAIAITAAAVATTAAMVDWAAVATATAGTLKSAFETIHQDAERAFTGIQDALTAGDLGLAAKILWLTLVLEWKRGTNALSQTWTKHWNGAMATLDAAWASVLVASTNVMANLRNLWVHTTAFFEQTWLGFTHWLKRGWNNAVGFLEKTWIKFKRFFDDSIDVDAEVARVDQEIATDEADMLREMADARQRHVDELAAIERERAAQEAAIWMGLAIKTAERLKAQIEDLGAAQAELDAARAEWEQAIADAEKARNDRDLDQAAQRPFNTGHRLIDRILGAGRAAGGAAAGGVGLAPSAESTKRGVAEGIADQVRQAIAAGIDDGMQDAAQTTGQTLAERIAGAATLAIAQSAGAAAGSAAGPATAAVQAAAAAAQQAVNLVRQGAKQLVDGRGLFNFAHAQSLLGGGRMNDAQERIADSTEQTAKTTKQIEANTRNLGMGMAP